MQIDEDVQKILNEKYSLIGIDGNAFVVMGYVTKAMKEQNFSQQEIAEYREKATSGNYDTLLAVSMEYIDKCNNKIVDKPITSQNVGPISGSFTISFGPGKYFLGDICYALPDKIYDEVWGNKYNYENGYYTWEDEEGQSGAFAVAGTAYGDGEYYGGTDVFLVDAGVLGVTDITDDQRYTDAELKRLGKVVNVVDKLIFSFDNSDHSFSYNVDGKEFTVETNEEEEEEDYSYDEEEDNNW